MTTREWLSLLIGSLELSLALIVLRHLGRFGRTFPWLAALMAFFVLRAADRIYLSFRTTGSFGLDLMLDGLTVVVILLLIVGLDWTVRTLRAVEDAAQLRRDEYERALVDYRRLARHRLANPLAAIYGSVATLRTMPELDEDTRTELLRTIDEQAHRLEHVVLEPTAQGAEERSLRPRPEVPRER